MVMAIGLSKLYSKLNLPRYAVIFTMLKTYNIDCRKYVFKTNGNIFTNYNRNIKHNDII